MYLQATDDIHHTVYCTYKGDRSLLEDNHYCHPGGVFECTNHTTKEVFDSLQEQPDTEFYAVIDDGITGDEGIVGFITYRDDMSKVVNFGMNIAFRRSGRAAEFMELVRNFGNNQGISVKVCDVNKRDAIMLKANGFAKATKTDPEHTEMVWIGPTNELGIRRELEGLYKQKREIGAERRAAISRYKKRLKTVQNRIDELAKEYREMGQLSLFNKVLNETKKTI